MGLFEEAWDRRRRRWRCVIVVVLALVAVAGALLTTARLGLAHPVSGVVTPDASRTPVFTASSSTLTAGTTPIAVATGSLTGGSLPADTLPDLAVANNDTVSLFASTAAGGFTLVQTLLNVGAQPQGVAIGDIDGDDSADIVVAARSRGAGMSLFTKRATGTGYTDRSAALPASSAIPIAVKIGDFNGDGKGDIASVNTDGTLVLSLRTNADGAALRFRTVTLPTGPSPNDLAVGDLNGDGRPDFAVANAGSDGARAHTVTVYLKGAHGSGYTRHDVPITAGDSANSVAIGDLDGDGRADIAAGVLLSDTVDLLLQNADGSYTPTTVTAGTAADVQKVQIADLNGDGHPDLAVTNQNDSAVMVLLRDAAGGYTATRVPAAFPSALAIADLAGDGRPDIVATNATTNTLTVLSNTTR
jgi:hypothetical protein